MIDLYERGSSKFDWWQDWRGECVAIVAGGPSVKGLDLNVLRDRIHVVVINESHALCPFADILYSCDASWWEMNRIKVKDFGGLKLTWQVTPTIKDMGLQQIEIAVDGSKNFVYDFVFDEPGVVGSGGNSGFQIINVVAQFGATGIMLLGFDMKIEKGNRHWHGDHLHPLKNPDAGRFSEWRRWMDRSAPRLTKHGIEVINCSPISALTAYKKLSVDETFRRWGL